MTLRSRLVGIADALLLPLLYPFALLQKKMCDIGIFRFPRCKAALIHVGVFPIRNHYYEPRFDYSDLKVTLSRERALPGISWNTDGQLELLEKLSYAGELTATPTEKSNALEFYMHNCQFGPGRR